MVIAEHGSQLIGVSIVKNSEDEPKLRVREGSFFLH